MLDAAREALEFAGGKHRHELDDKLLSGMRQLESGEFTTYEEDEFDRFRADVMRVAETRKQRGNGLP